MPAFNINFLDNYSESSIIDEIKRVAAAIGEKSLTISEFSKHSKVGVTTIRRKFGSWPSALEAAGLEHLYNKPSPANKSRTLARSLSDDDLLAELRRVAAQLNQTSLGADDLRRNAIVGVDAIRNRFGTLKQALRSAGLEETAHGRRYTDDECFENMLAVWTHYGRPPTHDEMNQPPSKVGSKAYTRRWQTWRKALVAFVHAADCPESGVTIEAPKTAPAKVHRVAPEDRHEIPLSLRYRVLKRDSFKCVICGRSPALEVGLELHVDHIIPFSKGGKTVEQNLRCLCKDCNLGKGASD